MRKTLVIAPHPDDETLGCGGYLLRQKAEGNEISWLIVTSMEADDRWNQNQTEKRATEIGIVKSLYGFMNVRELSFSPGKLDTVDMDILVGEIGGVINDIKPDQLLVPHAGDAHTDHENVFKASVACVKWFRYPSIKRAMCYETISETNFGYFKSPNFVPNFFVDISSFLQKKIDILTTYSSEIQDFPFPRSTVAVKALAELRGAESGFLAAESFAMIFNRE